MADDLTTSIHNLESGGLDPKKKGANRDQHSRDQRAQSGDLWSGGLDPKMKGANRNQHSRDQRAQSGDLWSGGLDPDRGDSRDQRGRWFLKA
ncbi:hypothetical protein Tco_0464666 [Tanacetum coccineum]